MRVVAFLRNVNLGQPKSPTRPQLEAAFVQAGATSARSFLSNGIIVYTVARSRQAQPLANRVCAILNGQCGMDEPAFAYSLGSLAAYVAEDPFAQFGGTALAECAVTFFEPVAGMSLQPLLASPRKDCLIFRIEAGIAFSVTFAIDGSTGYPTPVLVRAPHSPVTTRSWKTILRLVEKHT